MFSIIIPVHNKFPHLDRSIQSVLNQSFRDFELILIDDASTDGSAEKLPTYKDDRIIIRHRDIPGAGGYAARNLGIEQARQDWICFLDADDEWDPEYLQSVKEAMEANPEAELISVGWTVQGGDGRFTTGSDEHFTDQSNLFGFTLADYLTRPTLVWTSAVSLKKSLLVTAGAFPANGPWKNGGDVDTWIRCLERSKENIRLKKNLAIYYRDSVNRVTDYQSNHSKLFCAYETLQKILSSSTDDVLNQSIKNFVNRNIYNIAARHLSRSKEIDFELLAQMYKGPFKSKAYIKLALKKVKLLF